MNNLNTAIQLTVVALLGLLLFLLSKTLNNPSPLPPFLNVKTSAYSYKCVNGGAPLCDVYFTEDIAGPDEYTGIVELIENAPLGSTINLHLIGYGGNASSVYYLYNAIQTTKAHVNTVVEGPVYSAHAMLAFVGHTISIKPASLFMFHVPARRNDAGEYVFPVATCIEKRGTKDRGTDGEKKCIDQANYNQAMVEMLFKSTIERVMTFDEIKRMNLGEDIYISSEDMVKRVRSQLHAIK